MTTLNNTACGDQPESCTHCLGKNIHCMHCRGLGIEPSRATPSAEASAQEGELPPLPGIVGEVADREPGRDATISYGDLAAMLEDYARAAIAADRALRAPQRGKLTIENAPIGTKAPAIMGGWWYRTERGWKWQGPEGNGGTFPRPGGDWNGQLIAPEAPRAPQPPAVSREVLAWGKVTREMEAAAKLVMGRYGWTLDELWVALNAAAPSQQEKSAERSDLERVLDPRTLDDYRVTVPIPAAPSPQEGKAAEGQKATIIADWPACNPACDYESPSGAREDCRNEHCSCEPAKASVARQRAAHQDNAQANEKGGA